MRYLHFNWLLFFHVILFLHCLTRRPGAASAVMRALYWTAVVKRELNWKSKLSIYQSICDPTLTYSHELWEVTQRMRFQIQSAGMSFFRRAARLRRVSRFLGHVMLVTDPEVGGENCWRDYTSNLDWEHLGIPQEELENVIGEKDVRTVTWPPWNQQKMGGWITPLHIFDTVHVTN